MEPAIQPRHGGAGVQIEYHADDYGLFPTQSQRILSCHKRGNLNGVSVMPNSPHLHASMEQLPAGVAVTVHLNLIEGDSLSGQKALTDEHGVLACSFGKLLVHSFLPGRKDLRNQLKAELRCQIQAVSQCLAPGSALRLDSHAHYHMLPVVFDAMMDVIREDNLNISYIRMPQEQVGLYLRHWRQLRDFSSINLVKVAVLNLLAWRNRRTYRDYLSKLDQKLFLGVFLSGRMHRDNVEPLLADAIALAERRGWDMELLAHPGGVFEPEDIRRITYPGDVEFLTSQMRNREASMFEIS